LIDFINAVCPHLSKPTPKVCEFDDKENDKKYSYVLYLVLTIIVVIIGLLLIFYCLRRRAQLPQPPDTTINNDNLDETQPMPTDSTLRQ